tara:strand:+ start:1333 stop:2139 length:807 start_codon:yes stop_codon:yes gene_type:complete
MKSNYPLVSVLINNYNNENYCIQSINSILKQNYKKIEIIFYDDFSNDLSLNKVTKLKNKKLKIIKNTTRGKNYSFNQMNAIFKSLAKSKGEIVCILDSDDFFRKDKIKRIVNFFKKNKQQEILFDRPINFFNKDNVHKSSVDFKKRHCKWPILPPTSCISLRKKSLKNAEKEIFVKNFKDLWFDFRIATYFSIKKGQFNVLDDHLTFYRHHSTNYDKKFRKFLNLSWWRRRDQAFKFLNYIDNKAYKENYLSFDNIITKLINKITFFL